MIPVQLSTELSTIARDEGTRQLVISDDSGNVHIYCYNEERLVMLISEISVTVEQHSLWQRWLP